MSGFVAAVCVLAMLGSGDWVTIVLFALTLGGNAVTGYVASKVRLIDSLSTRVEQREGELAAKAEQLVEAKVNARFGQLQQSIEFVGRELAAINRRLDQGDGKFSHLDDRSECYRELTGNDKGPCDDCGGKSRGLGDTVAWLTTAAGIKPCKGCKKRQALLNRLVPYGAPAAPNESRFITSTGQDTPGNPASDGTVEVP